MRHRVLGAAAALAVAVALAACSAGGAAPTPSSTASTTADLISTAQAEGQVTWYTRSAPATVKAVTDAFAKKYGITVTSALSSGSDLGTQIGTDVRSSGSIKADVVMTADLGLAASLKQQKLLQPLTASDFPGLPKKFVIDGSTAVYQISVDVIAYNTDSLGSFAPSSWKDLLDPRLSGKIMVNDPRGSAAWSGLWSTILHDKRLGSDYVSSIAKQDYQPVATSIVGTQQLIAGQGSALIAGLPVLFTKAIADGQPITYFTPADPTPVFYNVAGLPTGSAHPAAGRLFLTWLLSPEGQSVINGSDQTASPLGTLDGVTGAVPLPADYSTPPAPAQVAKDLPEVLKLLGFN